MFLQYMLQQVMLRNPKTSRFVLITKPITSLPREVMTHRTSTHICADCCHEHDFSFDNPTKILELPGTVTVSKSYVQDELYEEEEADAQTEAD